MGSEAESVSGSSVGEKLGERQGGIGRGERGEGGDKLQP